MNIWRNYLRIENIEFANNYMFNEILALFPENTLGDYFEDLEIYTDFKKRWLKIINNLNNGVEGIESYNMSFFELNKSRTGIDIELNPALSIKEKNKCHAELENIHFNLKDAVKQSKYRYRKKIFEENIKNLQKRLILVWQSLN